MDGSAVPCPGVPVDYTVQFVDRDWKVYSAIINYLRDGELPKMHEYVTRNVAMEAARTGMTTLAPMIGGAARRTKRHCGAIANVPPPLSSAEKAQIAERGGGAGQLPGH